ncbi:hypothetical protein WJX72_001290 [[Myrmecia] bisecta]|uniref:Uncharacterized protein n=1 Tax=[Myrmecia] bisecta TaxID=41462 RepID=A0AAW1PDI1_9CHLO
MADQVLDAGRDGRPIYVTEAWWNANTPAHVSWDEFKRSSHVVSTTAAIFMGLETYRAPRRRSAPGGSNLTKVHLAVLAVAAVFGFAMFLLAKR